MPVVRSVRAESVALIEPDELLGALDMPLPPLPVVLLPVVLLPVVLVPVVPLEVAVPEVSLLLVEPLPEGEPLELLDPVLVEPLEFVLLVESAEVLVLFEGAALLPLTVLSPLAVVSAATGSAQAAAMAITTTLCLKLFMLTPVKVGPRLLYRSTFAVRKPHLT